MRTAIVGAGVAGSSCALALCRAGVHVSVFDVGRNVGGRTSTRVVSGERAGPLFPSGLQFDHGAPAFERGQDMEACLEEGLITKWKARQVVMRDKFGASDGSVATDLYVAVPQQDSLVKGLLDDRRINVRSQVRVSNVSRSKEVWCLGDIAGESLGEFDSVVLATHPSSLLELTVPDHVKKLVEDIEAEPRWSLMAVLSGEEEIEWDIADVYDKRAPDIDKIVVESNKPYRKNSPVSVVAYTTSSFAAANLDTPRTNVADALSKQLEKLLSKRILYSAAHRWSKAISLNSALTDSLYSLDRESGLGVVGDFFGVLPGKVVTAYNSGVGLAAELCKLNLGSSSA